MSHKKSAAVKIHAVARDFSALAQLTAAMASAAMGSAGQCRNRQQSQPRF
jgi:hypothetical protein